ncbi:aspartate/glutamate racemase family protein [Jannaschia ovalis]|uniref:Aspartate/glutamate racemase family protein n=1 Tax=Jannaschia ovalis TaxID=3038773 RepID=A0ABY8LDX4_9RHOB|nr:aspartate/glutamate racemase family protein [Jannaschia sp. GRR-S6-38]WGH79506.1 aspartate/glutamate racemase family protein [Jannaschia sp. GRR-S6-38]
MPVILINPNSTAAMTATMLAAARAAAPGLPIEGWTSRDGPPAIQGEADGAVAAGPLLDLVERADRQGAEAIVIGCFDDTALPEARARASCPVIGIGQAAFHYAALRGRRFSVVTSLPVAVPIIEANIAAYGLSAALARVRASDVPVLALEEDPDAALVAIRAEARAAVAEDGAETIVLGCAGMARITAELRRSLEVPVIDAVEAAAGCAFWLTAGAAIRATGPASIG